MVVRIFARPAGVMSLLFQAEGVARPITLTTPLDVNGLEIRGDRAVINIGANDVDEFAERHTCRPSLR